MEYKLYKAIVGGDTSEVLALLEAHDVSEWINKPAFRGCTCLWWACVYNNKIVVNKLLTLQNIDINKSGFLKFTPLYIATYHKHIEIIEQLLSQGAVCQGDVDNCTPLHCAAGYDDTDTLECLLKNSSKHINTVTNSSSFTPVHTAANRGRLEAVKLLIKYGANITVKAKGQTPYDVAMNNKHQHVAAYLKCLAATDDLDLKASQMEIKQQSQCNGLKPENSDLNSQKNGLRPESSDLNSQNNGLKPENIDLNSQYNGLKPENSHLNSQNNGLKPENSNVNFQNNGLQPENSDLNSQCNGLKPENSNLNSQYNELKGVNSDLKAENMDLKTRVSKLEQIVKPKTTKNSKNQKSQSKSLVQCIQNNLTYLLEHLLVDDHLDYLYQEKALSLEDYEVIRCQASNTRQIREMLFRLIKKNNSDAIKVLYKSIEERAEHLLHIFK